MKNRTRSPFRSLAAVAIGALASPAFAQLEKVNSTLNAFQSALYSIGAVLLTIALMWTGYKMAFQQARWAEVSNVALGCIIAGSASSIVGWLMG